MEILFGNSYSTISELSNQNFRIFGPNSKHPHDCESLQGKSCLKNPSHHTTMKSVVMLQNEAVYTGNWHGTYRRAFKVLQAFSAGMITPLFGRYNSSLFEVRFNGYQSPYKCRYSLLLKFAA